MDNYCECGNDIAPNDIQSLRRGMCYPCWIGVGTPGPTVTWRGGGGYTREDFHSRTNAEVLRENDVEGSVPA